MRNVNVIIRLNFAIKFLMLYGWVFIFRMDNLTGLYAKSLMRVIFILFNIYYLNARWNDHTIQHQNPILNKIKTAIVIDQEQFAFIRHCIFIISFFRIAYLHNRINLNNSISMLTYIVIVGLFTILLVT